MPIISGRPCEGLGVHVVRVRENGRGRDGVVLFRITKAGDFLFGSGFSSLKG